MQKDIVMMRHSNGSPIVQGVEQTVVWHSPDGFEWGYGGSGPADLALNILEEGLRRRGWKGNREQCGNSTCFSLACRLHQDFKWKFIASMQREGGRIRWDTVQDYLEARLEYHERNEIPY